MDEISSDLEAEVNSAAAQVFRDRLNVQDDCVDAEKDDGDGKRNKRDGAPSEENGGCQAATNSDAKHLALGPEASIIESVEKREPKRPRTTDVTLGKHVRL